MHIPVVKALRKYRFILPKQDTAQENIDPYSQAHLLTYQDHDSKQVEYVSKRTSRVEPTTRLDVVASTSEPAIQWEDADSVYQPEKIQRWKRNSASTTHDGRFMCDLCEKTYKWKGDLNRHMKYECQYVIGKPSFDCPHCDYSTVRPSYLKYHMVYETKFTIQDEETLSSIFNPNADPLSERNVDSENINRRSQSGPKLPSFPAPHLRIKRYCEVCSKVFSTAKDLQRHQDNECKWTPPTKPRQPTSRPWSCDLCSKTYKMRHHLKPVSHRGNREMRIRWSRDLVESDSMSFDRERDPEGGGGSLLSLETEGLERFQCDGCPKSYKRKFHLTRHQKYECCNTLDKPELRCTICQYSTNYLSSLKVHCIRKHGFTSVEDDPLTTPVGIEAQSSELITGDIPVQSSRPRSFKKVRPESVKKFRCDLCFKSYNRRDNLVRHQKHDCKNNLEKIVFPCEQCSYVGKRKDHLQYHMLKVHTCLPSVQVFPRLSSSLQ
ncbi:unnamed protein product [Bemisia tabaci]|uniref:C2H2-type domain-containing protein n=1 Tax=Bemisia tabaci TaxID=7038 RepID=A0A9P0EW53_BEMTA|nr:unnamed protein product [Bemisia tabaci]